MSGGFRECESQTIRKKGTKVAEVNGWYGQEKTVDRIGREDVVKPLKKNKSDDVKLTISYDKPVKAPVKKGDTLGFIKAKIPGQADLESPLIAAKDVNKVGLWGKISKNINYLIWGTEQFMNGKFITFEGGEGTGKSTQIKLLEQFLLQKKLSVVLTKEPGGTKTGQDLKR